MQKRRGACLGKVRNIFIMLKVMARSHNFFVNKYSLPKHAGSAITLFLLDCTRSLGFATQNPRCSRPTGNLLKANYASQKLASQLLCLRASARLRLIKRKS